MALVLDHSFGLTTCKRVTNLGWLLRNWQSVHHFVVEYTADTHDECYLAAHMTNGNVYLTSFASASVLRSFLNRPVFRGLTVTWDGAPQTITKGVNIHG